MSSDGLDWDALAGRKFGGSRATQWVAYIGEEVGPAPEQPVPLVSGAQLLDLIRAGAISPRGRRP